jgi:hypothetical protein
MSKIFYLFSIVVVPAFFMAASWLAGVEALGLDAEAFRAWSMIASFYGFGVFVLLWYRAWGALAAGPQKFNPGRTALLLLVPLVNLYWLFRAVGGWPKAYNHYASEKGLNLPPLDDRLFLAYCIFTVAAVAVNPVHMFRIDFYSRELVLLFISQVTKTVQLCLDAVIVWQVCAAVNRLRAPDRPSP